MKSAYGVERTGRQRISGFRVSALTLLALFSFGICSGVSSAAERPTPPQKPERPEIPSLSVKPSGTVTRPVPPTKPTVIGEPEPRPVTLQRPKRPKPPKSGKPDAPDVETSGAIPSADTGSKPESARSPLPKTVVAKRLDPISDAIGCRIGEPVSVSAIGRNQVLLKPVALIGTPLVPLLLDWIDKDLQPSARQILSDEVTELVVSSSYVCRTRNNKPGAKLSEHALGNAIDISGFRLKSGDRISVETDWEADTQEGKFLQAIHKAACAHFSTVLGPDADTYHKTHFHLDRGRHGKTGKYRICQ